MTRSLVCLSQIDRWTSVRSSAFWCLFQSPAREAFWMKLADLSIVIMNLIAYLPFLYHNPKQPVSCID